MANRHFGDETRMRPARTNDSVMSASVFTGRIDIIACLLYTSPSPRD